MLNLKTNL